MDDAFPREHIVEVSFTLPDGYTTRRAAWADMDSGKRSDIAPGSYRLRVSARGRDDVELGEASEEVVNHYQLQLWLALTQPDSVLKSSSANAEYMHQTNGNHS